MDYKEKLKAIINSNKTPFIDIDTFLKYFPELKESEDERIRESLILYLRSILSNKKYGDKFIEDWIDWLKKLPIEKLPFEMKTPEESLGIDSDTYSKIVDECVYGEQKPADNQFTPEQASVLDKIYLEKVYPNNGVLPNGLNYNQSPNGIEYIRTDAFIEKVCNWLEQTLSPYIPYCNIDIDLAIEDFKKYMKGE